MDFQLNPNAAEFIPVSPQFMGTRMDLVEDFPVSGSPFKQVPQMDDIQVPSQSEFEKEVCQRPREVDNEEKEYQNGDNLQNTDYTDFLADKQKVTPVAGNMDDSEISSTKAEFGDESSVSFLTASEFHRTGISAIDESFSSCEREYDIAKDPMAMSFTPSDFEAAFDKGVDLNAVHDLSNSDLEETNGILDKEEEEEEEEEELLAKSPNLENDTVNDKISIASNNEKPITDKTEKSEIRAEFVNLSSQQDYSEDTFIEHADELKASTVDFLNLQPESSNQQESQETAKYDHSPLTENYSGEFESEKEPVSVDNEQPLSPSSADIDETKPIDETSEDAALLGNELQKEICSNDGNTPSSLSPIPDAMESDLATESAEIQSSKPVQSSLHPDAPEFMPGNYNFQSFGMDNNDVCQVSHIKATDSYQAYSTEAGSAFEIVKQDLVANIQFDEKEDEPVCTKPLIEIKPEDFSEEQDVCVRPLQIHSELTPPLSPQEEKHIHDIICPVETSEEVIESKKIPEEANIEDRVEEMMESMKESMETNISTEEIKSVESEEPIKELILNLSDSMQEFTGLESQLQPTEEEILKAKVIEDLQEEIIKKKELIDVTEPEKSSELVVETEYMVQEQKEVQEFPEVKESEIKEVEIEQLKLKEPKVEKVEIQESEFKESEVKEPEIKEFEMKEPEIEEFKIKEPEIQEHKIKELELEIKESEIKEFEIKESEIKEPEIKEVEIKESEIKEIEIKEPEIKEPEIKEPEIKEPEIKEPEIKEPEIEVSSQKPEIKELLKEPEVKETEVKEPEIEKVAEVPENKVVETAAIATATAAVAAGAVVAQSKAKAKTLAAKPTKTTTSKATPTRSTPTSPSKTVSSTTRTSTAAMKKPSTTTPSRPKDLDAPKKSTISSTAISKPSVAKSASKTTSTTATKSTSKTSVSTTSKPKPIATTASKSVTVTDKKPTANGDVKSLSKTATATKSSSKASPLATKTTLVKTSSTRPSTGTTTVPKVRSSSANKLSTTAKTSSTTTTIGTTTSSRPKTAPPSSGTASKPRMSLNKLPAIDKQVKETANKQISMGRTSTPASKTTSRLSTTSSSTTTIKRASLTAKTTTAASPTKKSTPVSKTSKTSLSGKTAGEKGKILQNGVSENVEINTIIDDMPKKDLSPVVTPNDNQLIMSSD